MAFQAVIEAVEERCEFAGPLGPAGMDAVLVFLYSSRTTWRFAVARPLRSRPGACPGAPPGRLTSPSILERS